MVLAGRTNQHTFGRRHVGLVTCPHQPAKARRSLPTTAPRLYAVNPLRKSGFGPFFLRQPAARSAWLVDFPSHRRRSAQNTTDGVAMPVGLKYCWCLGAGKGSCHFSDVMAAVSAVETIIACQPVVANRNTSAGAGCPESAGGSRRHIVVRHIIWVVITQWN